MSDDIPQQIGPYSVRQRLGAGAMGEVYLGVSSDGVEVAIKLMAARLIESGDFTERFNREIDLAISLEHPHIARAIGHGDHEGRPYLAMEFVRGPALDHVLKKNGPLPEAIALRLVIQIAKGLEHAYHTAGLIHRDVKPANILIAKRGEDPFATLGVDEGDIPKIIDFGLAKSVSSETQHALTMTGAVMGTPHYMAPEQIRGEREVDLHADIYALGATLHHLITGQYPYPEPSPGLVMTAHLTKPVPDPGQVVRGLNAGTRSLVQSAMAKKPGDRPLTWRAFITVAETALRQIGGSGAVQRTSAIRPGSAGSPREARPGSAPAVARTTSVATVVPRSDAKSSASTGPTLPPQRRISSSSYQRVGSGAEATVAAVPPIQPESDRYNAHEAPVSSPEPTGRIPTSTRINKPATTPVHKSAVMRGGFSDRLAKTGGWTDQLHWIALALAVIVAIAVIIITMT